MLLAPEKWTRSGSAARRAAWVLLLLAGAGTLHAGSDADEKHRVAAVHPGTELLHIINYLSGIAPPMVESYSYRSEVDAWFAPHASHPAVEHAKGLPYNDFVELGWAFDEDSMALQMPQGFGWLGEMKDPQFLRTYLELSEQFAVESDFAGFFASQQANYRTWAAQFEGRLDEVNPEPVLWDFYGAPIDTTLYYSISPLGVTLRANMVMEDVRPDRAHFGVLLIPFDPQFLAGDGYDAPDFNYTDLALQHAVWHEASHIAFEELAEGHRDALMAISYRDCLSRRLEPFDDAGLNTYFFVHEVVSDTVAVFLKHQYVGTEAAENHLVLNENVGGQLYRPVFEHFRDHYFDSRNELGFGDYLPALIDFIDTVEPVNDCN